MSLRQTVKKVECSFHYLPEVCLLVYRIQIQKNATISEGKTQDEKKTENGNNNQKGNQWLLSRPEIDTGFMTTCAS